MNPTEIEFAVRDLVAKPYDPDTFPYDLIGIHNASKVTVSKLKSGQTNGATRSGDIVWKSKLFFRPAAVGADLGATVHDMAADPLLKKQKPRFLLTTDGEQVYGRDLKTGDTLNAEFAKLDENADFLLPLAGYERREAVEEHPADIKAAKRLKKLYDAILAGNPTWASGHHTHELNLLMTRLLFCFYAEKTNIFHTPKIFTDTVTQYTKEDGSDVAPLLDRLFRIMNVEESKRLTSTPAVESKFPYVNGSLFEDTVGIPAFNRTARRQMLECGDLDWTTINPDIFGSMIQTIAQDGTRSDLGMHYTSVPNIMKVLQPLFLGSLRDAYEKAKDSVPKLEALLGRLSKIRVFDPACGSGNFLIIAYKEMRKIEIEILTRIGDISPKSPLQLSGISLDHFYGADLVDFSCETAKLSLWIAEHQMNTLFREIFGDARGTLPLAKISTIHSGNALRLSWEKFYPPDSTLETYLCGNPPYQGSKEQTPEQKRDVDHVFSPHCKLYRRIDYIGCWFVKAAEYLVNSPTTQSAFVSTNSICQGEHVGIVWPIVFSLGSRIVFAHTSFTWKNNASHNAGVTCIIVGLARGEFPSAKLSSDSQVRSVQTIGPYLVPGTSIVVSKERSPISDLPSLTTGCEPGDGGHLVLSTDEYKKLLGAYPEAKSLIRPYLGSRDFLNGGERYCLWIADKERTQAERIPPIRERIARVQSERKGSPWADIPYKFGRDTNLDKPALVIPKVSSEHRQYLQVGLANDATIANNTLRIVYDPPNFLLALLVSRMHYLWAQAVGGRMRTDIQYSTTIVYNTFPLPKLSAEQSSVLGEHSRAILRTRAKYPGKTLAWLYNPETMPVELHARHRENDDFIEKNIYGRSFRDDTERLELLFKMYERQRKSKLNTFGFEGDE
uniref:site-specific DNA-methyltransferase (adenine-specific) n=1 Tax=mine drainage metagenome TaxID=410659 RepID=E6Q0T4_9ZZZZ